jgi:hypothetical protein
MRSAARKTGKGKPALLSGAQIRRMKEDQFIHFLNPGAIRYTRSWAMPTGWRRWRASGALETRRCQHGVSLSSSG